MRTLASLTALLVLAAPLAGQAHTKPPKNTDPDNTVSDATPLPTGWTARTDEKGKEAGVKLVTMAPGYHVTLGPATILYRAADRAEGRFRAVASFTQTKAPHHPEGYGIFVGGKSLDGAGQAYTYFLVRGDGKYIVKRREGDSVSSLVTDWTADPAIQEADAAGKATNRLEVAVNKDGTSFWVNGKQVYKADSKAIDGKGVVGLRVNHNLDVHIADFAVHQM
jgi:hypothetical protein